MTLDELMKVYNIASSSNVAFLQYEGPDHRAGIRAVVAALRDELLPPKQKASASNTIVRAIILQKFNEILASDGVDKAGAEAKKRAAVQAKKSKK
jgi:hypothetical protein